MKDGGDELYGYYQRELDYLRTAGREFAQQHPETARRLELGELESPDPHVERLIESFAFLTGRIRRDLDNEAPETAAALLDVLLPNSLAPLPSMTVVRLRPDGAPARAASEVPAHTLLHASARPARQAEGAQPVECQFRTCYPLALWPLDVVGAAFEEAADHPGLDQQTEVAGVLRLSLQCEAGVGFGQGEDCIAPEHLRFHLHDSWHNAGALYDWLLCHVKRVLLVPAGRVAGDALAGRPDWREAGFAAGDAVLPVAGHAHPAYRQLQEYFAYPRKYLFFDATGLAQGLGQLKGARQADLLLVLTRHPPPALPLHAEQFLLGCTPAINLFPRTTETLRLDQRQSEYRLVPDARNDTSTEVHSILKVEASFADGQGHQRLSRYYDFGQVLEGEPAARWIARRTPGTGRRKGSTDVMLAFVGLGEGGEAGRLPLVTASTLCSNGRVAEDIPPDAPGKAVFRAATGSVQLHARCLYPPTPQVAPAMDGRVLWRLLSLLNLNQITLDRLAEPREGNSLAMLRRLLELANGANSVGGARQVRGLKRFECRSVVRPVRGGPVPGFRRGHELLLEFEEDAYSNGTPLMLAAVLQRFFQMFCNINSFASVIVVRGEEKVKEWLPATSSR